MTTIYLVEKEGKCGPTSAASVCSPMQGTIVDLETGAIDMRDPTNMERDLAQALADPATVWKPFPGALLAGYRSQERVS